MNVLRFGLTGALIMIVGTFTLADAQERRIADRITLERTVCFGLCPAYLLEIDSTGTVSFQPKNRGPEPNDKHNSRITPDQFRSLVEGFAAIRFSELKDDYPPRAEDGPGTNLTLTINGKSKEVRHFDDGPEDLKELERKIERTANVHQWLHGNPRQFTLESPVAGPMMGGGENVKNEVFVRADVYSGIKPGMTALMLAAWKGDPALIRDALKNGEKINAVDGSGWTALMVAAVLPRLKVVTALLDAGALVNLRDNHGDTALIAAAAVRYSEWWVPADVISALLAHGASVEATNNLGESARMWAARAGDARAIALLLKAGAKPARLDKAGHNALFYLKDARVKVEPIGDTALLDRYDQGALLLK
jgi:Domain of unknown function (DUF6438)/Ankyrin repeats (3 copies)